MSKRCFYAHIFVIMALASTCLADWRSDANDRIEQFRKRNVQITVLDVNDNPMSGVTVEIEQVKHRFAFGSCINYRVLYPSSYPNYDTFFQNHFEWAVCENETKWTSNESTQGTVTYSQADSIYDWCNSREIPMRGHCIYWEQQSSLPSWLPGLAYAPWPQTSNLYSACQSRINSVVSHFADKFLHWDVDNEQLSDSFFDRLEVGGPGSADVNSRVWMYQRAHELDPDCELFVNEYSGNSFGSYSAGPYVTLVNNLRSKGAPIHGIGIQAHINSPFEPENYWNNVLKPLGQLGSPIWATEFDSDTTDDTQRAVDVDNFYRVMFSDPNVEGIMMWGFMVGTTWRASGQWGIVSSSGVLNEAGQRYEALMDEWTTEDTNFTNAEGVTGFRGFHGTYEITLSKPGQGSRVFEVDVEPGTSTQEFVLDTNFVYTPPEYNPPTPNPLVWAVAPMATGAGSITMTAATATDTQSPPVKYYFECVTDTNKSSGWQSGTTYTAQSLASSTLYTFKVRAGDSFIPSNVTGWSSELSATTFAADANIVGSWAAGTTHAKESGLNRVLIFIAHEKSISSNRPVLASVTYGDQPMTKIIDVNAHTYNGASYVAAFMLKEPNIAAASGSTFTPTWNGTTNLTAYSSAFFVNVDQDNTIGATDINGVATNINPIVTDPLAANNGDVVVMGATCGNYGSYTLNNSFTEGTDQTSGSTYSGQTGVTGHKCSAGPAETPKATYSSSVNRQVILGFVLKNLPTCYSIQQGGLGMAADLNKDCFVDYDDVKVMAEHWLDTGCASPDYCGNADIAPRDGTVNFIDFSDLAEQWLLCNDPRDANCQ